MSGQPSILAEQLAYYRASAAEYGGNALDVPGQEELLDAIDGFRPTGDVLELACGPGRWTASLLRSATTVTAVDGAPEMLALARERVGPDAPVRFIEADLFSWRPDRRYDAVLFGFWISHVPDDRFEAFWAVVGHSLRPDGTVFFFDDNYRPDEELIEGEESEIVERRLRNGDAHRIVKVPHQPADLEQRLRSLGWDVAVSGTPGPFYWGVGQRVR